MMNMRERFNDNWPLLVFGGLGILVTLYYVGEATGEPLITFDFSWVPLLIAPYVPGAIAILKGLALALVLTILAALAGLVIIPFRDRLIEKRKEEAKQRKEQKQELRINLYQPATVRAPTVMQVEPDQGRALLEQQHRQMYEWISTVCSRYLKDRRPGTLPEMLQEIDKALAQLATHPVTAPAGPSWRDIAVVVEWARAQERLGVKATRNMLRAAKVQIPEADAEKGGAFNVWVKALPTLPYQSAGPENDEITLADGGPEATDGTTDADATRKERLKIYHRLLIPRQGSGGKRARRDATY